MERSKFIENKYNHKSDITESPKTIQIVMYDFGLMFEYAFWYIWTVVFVHLNILAQYLPCPLVDINTSL